MPRSNPEVEAYEVLQVISVLEEQLRALAEVEETPEVAQLRDELVREHLTYCERMRTLRSRPAEA